MNSHVHITDTDRINSVLDQLQRVKLGRLNAIHCPWCGGYNRRGVASQAPDEWKRPGKDPFCCDSFSEVARAISGVDEEGAK